LRREENVSLFRYRALIKLGPPRPGREADGSEFPSGTHKLMVHAWRPGSPPTEKYFAAEFSREENAPLVAGESEIVTITIADDEAPSYLGPGREFAIWGPCVGTGVISRRVFSTSTPS
jgi:hypothetical protein